MTRDTDFVISKSELSHAGSFCLLCSLAGDENLKSECSCLNILTNGEILSAVLEKECKILNCMIENTVKSVLETTCIKRLPASRDHCSDTTLLKSTSKNLHLKTTCCMRPLSLLPLSGL